MMEMIQLTINIIVKFILCIVITLVSVTCIGVIGMISYALHQVSSNPEMSVKKQFWFGIGAFVGYFITGTIFFIFYYLLEHLI